MNVGGYLSIFGGLAYDWLSPYPRAGPRAVLLAGVALSGAGYAGLWAASRAGGAAPYWAVALAAALAGNGGTWLDTAIMASAVANHAADRGTAVGVLKAGGGGGGVGGGGGGKDWGRACRVPRRPMNAEPGAHRCLRGPRSTPPSLPPPTYAPRPRSGCRGRCGRLCTWRRLRGARPTFCSSWPWPRRP